MSEMRREPSLEPNAEFGPAARLNAADHGGLTYTRRLERSNRLLTMSLGMMSFAFVGCVAGLIYMQVTHKPQFVFPDVALVQSPTGQEALRMQLYHGDIPTSAREQIAKEKLREYVCKREQIDGVTEGTRYNFVRVFTHPDYYRPFADFMDPNRNPESPLTKFKANNTARECAVLSIGLIPNSGKQTLWEAEIQLTDRRAGQEIQRSIWVVTFETIYSDLRLTPDETTQNPIGLQVGPYTTRPRVSEPRS